MPSLIPNTRWPITNQQACAWKRFVDSGNADQQITNHITVKGGDRAEISINPDTPLKLIRICEAYVLGFIHGSGGQDYMMVKS